MKLLDRSVDIKDTVLDGKKKNTIVLQYIKTRGNMHLLDGRKLVYTLKNCLVFLKNGTMREKCIIKGNNHQG